jgi:transposase
MMSVAPKIVLTSEERNTLEQWVNGHRTEVRLVQRASIVLKAAEGLLNQDISKVLSIPQNKVGRWRRRFAADRIEGIRKDRPRGDRRRKESVRLAKIIIEATTRTKPKDATHWSSRTLAKHLRLSASRIRRVWKKANLKPHLFRRFKVSNDPHFAEKVIDVVGLYTNPPEEAIVLCVDEKSQIQALDRTQKCLPLVRGYSETMTHDYERHGTTTLFAAYNVLNGTVIGSCMPRHRHQEWLKFLNQIDLETNPKKKLHLIVDNYSTHKHEKVKRWLKRHPRFHVHFIPTSSSWLNLVERWFGEITRKRIRRGTFRSVKEVIDAIMSFIRTHNQDSTPMLWTAKAEKIIEKVERARAVLQNVKQCESVD